jgi:DNA invertase Pin-like site-specific DNA recombinase
MTNYAYIRVSHVESLTKTSLDTQERSIKSYSKSNGFEIDYVYSEVISGGVDMKKRKVFSKFLSKLKRGDRIIVSRVDRLVRKILFLLQFVEDMKKKGIELHIANLGNVSDEGMSRMILNLLGVFADVEICQISERVRASKHLAKKDRKFLGGYLEFGYMKDEDNKLIPNPKEFEILQSMISLRIDGLGYRKISDEIKNKFSRRIDFAQIYRILKRDHNAKLVVAERDRRLDVA